MENTTTKNSIRIDALLPDGQPLILPTLHGMIYDCGGWVLSRDYLEPKVACLAFEFPRDICVEIYSALVSVGLNLAFSSHRTLEELCRCTPYLFDLPSRTIKAVDDASLAETTQYVCSLEIVQIHLVVRFVEQAPLTDDAANVA